MMKFGLFFLAALATCFSLHAPLAAQDPTWTWVMGELDDAAQQKQYVTFAERVFGFYQGRDSFVGNLVKQASLKQFPSSHTVLIGPVQAFSNPLWLGPDLRLLEDGGARLQGKDLLKPRTGIFLRSADGLHQLLTGLSLEGYGDIFSVPTGDADCTITVDGVKRYEGSWNGENLELKTLPFLPLYPSAAELESIGDVSDAIHARSVYNTKNGIELTAAFESKLEALLEDQRVLFVGESHWNIGVNQVFNRTLEYLLTKKAPRSVFLELEYSYSGHYNHYVGIADDDAAEKFLREQLHPIVNAETVLDTLEILRHWNRVHPQSPVSVACLDMEFGRQSALDLVVSPFFEAIEPGFKIASIGSLGSTRWLEEELVRLRKRLNKASDVRAPEHLPFLTEEYIRQVLQNLEDTMIPGENFMQRRQVHIVRNIVEFHGELLKQGFAIFKGGGYHAMKNIPPEEGVYRDAAYLHQVHEPTRGRVATLSLLGVGYNFSEVMGVDMLTRQRAATNYMNFLNAFQSALPEGFSSERDYYLLNQSGIRPMERVAARAGHSIDSDILWLDSFDAEKLQANYGVDPSQERAFNYDMVVFVLRSKIEGMRPLVYPAK